MTIKDLYERIEYRDMLSNGLEKLLNTVHPLRLRDGNYRNWSIEMRRAQDIWQVIRYQLWVDRHGDGDRWCVDSRKPTCMSGEPLPKMRRI